MINRITFILKDLFITPLRLFKTQIMISTVLAGITTLLFKWPIDVFLIVTAFFFTASIMISMANDNYNRQKEKLLQAFKNRK